MSELNRLAKLYDSDKADIYVHGGHDYARRYEPLFQALKDSIDGRPVKVLEIGVGAGGCLRIWQDFFSTMEHRADVHGVDNNALAISNVEKQNWGLKLACGDASTESFWKGCSQFGTDFDLIIDDGSHYSSEIISTFALVWPMLRAGGLYVCEDLHCSYQSYPFNPTPPVKPSVEFFKAMIDNMNDNGSGLTGLQRHGNEVDWMHFSKSFVVIKKR